MQILLKINSVFSSVLKNIAPRLHPRWISLFFTLAILFVGVMHAGSVSAMGLNDVTILLPLPYDQAESDRYLPSTDRFVPSSIINKLPAPIFNQPEGKTGSRQEMRLVGLRFDPCFVEGAPPFKCRHQIRLVFQPLVWDGDVVSTVDAAFHVFFDFDDQVWSQVLSDWKQTATTDPTAPLQVHPRIRLEGLSGESWAELRAMVLKYCSQKNLTRVTGSSVSWLGNVWQFRGVNVDPNGQAHLIEIATLGKNTVQSFLSDTGELQEFLTQLAPAPLDEPKLMEFIHNSVGARNSMSAQDLLEVYQSAITIENPGNFNPGNRDCASCHFAQTVRLWGEANIAGAIQAAGDLSMRFGSRFPLENRSEQPFNTNRIRSFGYFLEQPILSQRVINESASVAETLSTMINSGEL